MLKSNGNKIGLFEVGLKRVPQQAILEESYLRALSRTDYRMSVLLLNRRWLFRRSHETEPSGDDRVFNHLAPLQSPQLDGRNRESYVRLNLL